MAHSYPRRTEESSVVEHLTRQKPNSEKRKALYIPAGLLSSISDEGPSTSDHRAHVPDRTDVTADSLPVPRKSATPETTSSSTPDAAVDNDIPSTTGDNSTHVQGAEGDNSTVEATTDDSITDTNDDAATALPESTTSDSQLNPEQIEMSRGQHTTASDTQEHRKSDGTDETDSDTDDYAVLEANSTPTSEAERGDSTCGSQTYSGVHDTVQKELYHNETSAETANPTDGMTENLKYDQTDDGVHATRTVEVTDMPVNQDRDVQMEVSGAVAVACRSRTNREALKFCTLEEESDYNSMLYKALLHMFKWTIHAVHFKDCTIISRLLTCQQMEHIQSTNQMEGNSAAASLLLHYLKMNPRWYEILMAALDTPELKLDELKQKFAEEKERVDREWRASHTSSCMATRNTCVPDVTKAPVPVSSYEGGGNIPLGQSRLDEHRKAEEPAASVSCRNEGVKIESQPKGLMSSPKIKEVLPPENTPPVRPPRNRPPAPDDDTYNHLWQTKDTSSRQTSSQACHGVSPPTHTVTVGSTEEKAVPKSEDPYYFSLLESSVLGRSWYHGPLTREEAEASLQGTEIGTFLVRFNSHTHQYRLSVNCLHEVINIVIEEVGLKGEGNKGFILGHNSPVFRTIANLVEHYKSHPVPLRSGAHVRLRNPARHRRQEEF